MLIRRAIEKIGDREVIPVITGSGGLTLARHLGVTFVQEVIAVASSLQHYAPQTDVAIELGGEDAKIIYFDRGSVEQRMNGICAGGTGSFIDQMASLLQTDAAGLNEYAKNYKAVYPIAARCGVFAKTDIQPLINEGATKEDLSVSIFQAVVTAILALGGVLFAVVSAVKGDASHVQPVFTGTRGVFTVLLAVPSMFVGFDVIPQAAEEMKVPLKRIPKAIIASICLAASWYVVMILSAAFSAAYFGPWAGIPLTACQLLAEAYFAFAVSRVLLRPDLRSLLVAPGAKERLRPLSWPCATWPQSGPGRRPAPVSTRTRARP